MKKLISTAALLVSFVASGLAGDYTYTTNNNTLTITKYTGGGGAVTIPSNINSKVVASVGSNAFSFCTSLTSVIIPNSVTSIGDYAFYRTSLTAVKIPSSVTNIGYGIFSSCTHLTNALIGNGVTIFWGNTFWSCTNLIDVTIPANVTIIGGGAFYRTSLTDVTIPASVTTIGDRAFGDCGNLTKVYFQGNAPPSIDPLGFSGATNADVYYLPNTIGWTNPWTGRPTVLWNPSYTLTVNNGTGSGSYTNWQRVTIAPTVPAGKVFSQWTGDTQYVASVTSSTAIVTMPATTDFALPTQGVSLSATYADVYTLTVTSTHGTPIPSIGTNSYAWRGASVTCSVPSSVVDQGINWRNTGWTGTGDVPATGSTNTTGNIVLTNLNSSITWNWETSFSITNVTAVQRAGTKLVDITYDILSDVTNAVPIYLRIQNGTTNIPNTNRTGDIGTNVLPATNRHVVWDADADWNGSLSDLSFTLGIFGTTAPVEMVTIPAGTNSGTDPDFGAYSLTVTNSFYMDSTEVTKAKWDAVRTWALTNGYSFDNAGSGKATNHPVQTVNWYDTVKWCNARSQMEGRTPCYTTNGAVYKTGQNANVVCNSSTNGYRLPTITEWEYAARGGLIGKRFPWGDTITHSNANYNSSASYIYDISPTRGCNPSYTNGVTPYTSPVGSFAPNGYGLYNVVGNVWEWCWDATDSNHRYFRGGGWTDTADYARCGYKYVGNVDYVDNKIGFRSVCNSGVTSTNLLFSSSATAAVDSRDYTLTVYGEEKGTSTDFCLAFDGVNDQSSAITPSVSNSFTVECWINVTSAHQIDAQSTTGIAGNNQKYLFMPGNRGYQDAGMGISVGTNGVSIYDHGEYYLPALLVWTGSVTGWTHIAVVYNNKTPSLFINGVFVKTGLTSPRANVFPSGNIGGGIYGYMSGKVDEFRIWNYARTASQIQTAMNTQLSDTESGLKCYFDFNQGTGSNLVDRAGSANVTLINMDNSDWMPRDPSSFFIPVPYLGLYAWGSSVTCSVPSSAVDQGINWKSLGWTGTGSVPATGYTNSTGNIALTNLNSSITWNWGTSFSITNVVATQRFGTKLVDITYDIISDVTNAVPITLKIKNGTTNVTSTNCTGDIGTNVLRGTGRQIAWNMGTDWNTNSAVLTYSVMHTTATNLYASTTAPSDSRNYTLTVASAHGIPTPSTGNNSYALGSVVTCSVPSSVIERGVNWRNTGWSGTGDVPVFGSTNATGAILLTNLNSSITWNWQTSFAITNVVATQRAGTKLVDITYDILSDVTNAVPISLTIKNGTTNIPNTNCTGDIGTNVLSGTGRHIVWDAGTDWNGNLADLSFTLSTGAAIDIVPTILSDDFESSTVKTNWQFSAVGSPLIATNKSGNTHSGNKAFALGTSGGSVQYRAYWNLPTQMYSGRISWWQYDEFAQNTPYYTGMWVDDINSNALTGVWLIDSGWGHGTDGNSSYSFNTCLGVAGYTYTSWGTRTIGCHKYEVILNASQIQLFIDGALARAGGVSNGINRVHFYHYRDSVSLFDDLTIEYSGVTSTNLLFSSSAIAAVDTRGYTLTVNNGSGNGLFTNGTQVVISANAPAVGKAFDRWTGDTQYVASVTSSTTTVTIPAQEVSLTAMYVDVYYTLTVNSGTGNGSFTYGTQVAIAANVKTGQVFARWTGVTQYVANVTSSTTIVTMPAWDINLTAIYGTDITKPTLTIVTPIAKARILATNGLFTVRGTAADNKFVTNVLVQLNSGSWANASTTNRWKNWSVPVTLITGTNTVRAYSVDSAVNNSMTATVACTYVVTGTLNIQTNGSGTVTRTPVGEPEIDKPYTLTAVAKTGFVFSSWTGDMPSTNRSIMFSMTSNKTVAANFTDIQKPTVTITAPTALQRIVTNGLIAVRGTATDNKTVSNVLVRLDGGGWTNATTTNEWKNWGAEVTVSARTNKVWAYSMDTTGICSTTSSVTFVYVEMGNLTIQTNGLGSVTRAPATTPELGVKYTMTATPKAGSVFTNWTYGIGGDVATNKPAITFTMPSNLVLTANFIDTARPTVAITYPTASMRVMTNGTVVLRGTATDNGTLKEVNYQLYTGEWTNTVTTNIWKNWTAEYIPVIGLNTAKVYSVDMQGNVSATSTVVFTYVQGAIMQVQTGGTGAGTITPAYNGKILEIGKSYMMTAKAASGSVFTNWTDGTGVATNKAAITFRMTSNLVLTANFRSLTPMSAPTMDTVATAQAEITVDGSTADWAYVPRTSFSYASVTQGVAVALSGNNIALLLSGCPFSTSDTVLVYFKLRLSYGDATGQHTVDLWTSGSVLYGMIDGQLITGFEAVLLNGVLEVKFPVEQSPSQVTIEEIGCGMDLGDGTITELFKIANP